MPRAPDLVQSTQLNVEVSEECFQECVRQKSSRVVTTWTRVRSLGKGGGGEVSLWRCAEDNKVRAVKQVTKKGAIDFHHELEAAALFSQAKYRDAFVQSFGWYETPQNVFITMEFFPLGDLRNKMDHPFPEAEVQIIIGQILKGLSFMHERDFVHRDLKPENILVQEQGPEWWVKLTDFGISKRSREGDSTLRTQVYTPAFVAPEVLFVDESYTRAVDIWSTGALTFLLLTGENVVFTTPELFRFWSQEIAFPVGKLLRHNVEDAGITFVIAAMLKDPIHRPNAEACLRHPWLLSPPDNGREHQQTRPADLWETQSPYLPAEWVTSDHEEQRPDQLTDHNTSSDDKQDFDWSYPSLAAQGEDGNLVLDIGVTPVNGSQTDNQPPVAYNGAAVMGNSKEVNAQREHQLRTAHSKALVNKRPDVAPRNDEFRKELKANQSTPVDLLSVEDLTLQTNSALQTIGVDINWQSETSLKGHTDRVNDAAFSPDGQMIASASSDTTVRLWNVATGAEIKQLKGHTDWVWGVAFSPDGRIIATASFDIAVRLWNVATGAEIKQLESHRDRRVWGVAFSPDGRIIACVSNNKTVRLWDWNPDQEPLREGRARGKS